MSGPGLKAYDIPVITRHRAGLIVGGKSIVEAAEAKGVLTCTRTATGLNLMTSRQFEALVKFAQSYLR